MKSVSQAVGTVFLLFSVIVVSAGVIFGGNEMFYTIGAGLGLGGCLVLILSSQHK